MVDGNHARRGYNQSDLGWSICYTYLIGRTGKIIQARPDSDRTYCTKNLKADLSAIQIVVAGDFQPTYDKKGIVLWPGDQPTKRQAKALFTLIQKLKKEYNVKMENIVGHRDVAPDSCPGQNLEDLLQKMKKHL